MEKNTVRCNWCDWEGTEDDLVTCVDLSDKEIGHDINYFKGCPNCRADDYLIDIEIKNMAIQIIDVKFIADRLSITLTEKQIDEVLEMYPFEQEQDRGATWDLVIEQCIYNVLNY